MPDEYVTPADVFARLRIADPAAHPDEAYIVACTAAANALVFAELARGDVPVVAPADVRRRSSGRPAGVPGPGAGPRAVVGPPWPEPVWRAALGVAIRVYRFKDADTDIGEAWEAMGAPTLRIPRDPLAGYRDMLVPYMPGTAWSPA